MPPGHLPGEVFQAYTVLQDISWLVDQCISVLLEELEDLAGERCSIFQTLDYKMQAWSHVVWTAQNYANENYVAWNDP